MNVIEYTAIVLAGLVIIPIVSVALGVYVAEATDSGEMGCMFAVAGLIIFLILACIY